VIARAKSSLILVGLLLILLPTLAVLQYRWIGEVSAAERERLESSLRVASERFAIDLDTELSRLGTTFQIRDGFPKTADPIVERYQTWSETSPYARMLRTVYLLKVDRDNKSELYKLNLANHELEPSPLPITWENVRDRQLPTDMMIIAPIFRRDVQFVGPRPEDFRGRRAEPFPPRRPDNLGLRNDRPPRRGPGIPRSGGGPGPVSGPGPAEGAVLIELDRDVVLHDLVPALTAKHFSSHDETAYRIAIVSATKPQDGVLFSSAGAWKPEDIAAPDAVVDLFNPLGRPGFGGRGRGGPRGGSQGTIVSDPWQLLVKHRAGSLERAVEDVRLRNLAISFGILLVLGAGLITVVISSQRAHSLGRLQMEFAAGVSHELRTPLAVIRSAAHNLRSGIVRDKEDVEQYATIVGDEARRLSDMVEEVLLYTETQSGRKKYKLEPIDVNEIIDRAIAHLSPTIDMDNLQLKTRIEPDLPAVKADGPALVQCVLNLLSNAYKYGKREGPATIEIAAQASAGSKEVQLSVIDNGPGVDKVDQAHLFEPFYRGVKVESNTPGNGLGLHLVKRIMQAQGGRVTFSPAPSGGAAFTLHIPLAL